MTATAAARSSRPGSTPRRHLRVVGDRRPSVGLLTIVGIALFMGTLLATVAVQTLLYEARLNADDFGRQIDGATRARTELELEVATLESPPRILDVATKRLGMSLATERTYLASVVPGDVKAPVPPPGEDPFQSSVP